MADDGQFERLIREAEQAEFAGWDFSFLRDRLVEDPLPWDYLECVRQHLRSARTMLDLDTGGGEQLASLAPLPALCVATESYPPNVPIASRRLRPLGAWLVQTDPNTQNVFGPGNGRDGLHPERRVPLENEAFDLIICRHGSYAAVEIARMLRRGGWFVSQLVGLDNYPALNQRLQGPPTRWLTPDQPPPRTPQDAGLEIVTQREAKPQSRFKDIGAVIYYLKAVTWQIAGFNIDAYRDRLRRLHDEMVENDGLRTHYHRHLVVARKL